MEINEDNLLPLNGMSSASFIDDSDYVMKWASADEDPFKISFTNFVASCKNYIVEGFETSKSVGFFGSVEPAMPKNNMLWLNTTDAKIYRYVQVYGVWNFEENTSPTTVYRCDMSLIENTEDFGTYSIAVLGANNYYILASYKGAEILDRQEMLDLINSKVDKVLGKSLIADTEITRLAGVDNYNDTELRALIAEKRDKLVVTEISGTNVSMSMLGNTYYKFTDPLLALTISNFYADEQETIIDFTTGDSFVFSYPTGLYNLYGNDINNNERVLISIHDGVMEIRKRNESAKSFDFELLDVPTSGTVTLKRSTEARFKAALTNTSVFTIGLANPTANKVNEYALILQTGASKPTISFPTAVWFPATPTIEVNKTYIILFKKVLNNVGTYDTFGLIL